MKYRQLLCSLSLALLSGLGRTAPTCPLDVAPLSQDAASLQRGAQTFRDYCLSCHSAVAMRYDQLHDLGLSDAQIKTHLLPAGHSMREAMRSAMSAADGQAQFGVAPPDLSVIAKARGADWLYTYLRSFERDPSQPSGWKNRLSTPNAMPHVLYPLQMQTQVLFPTGPQAKSNPLRPLNPEYDQRVVDLVNYLVFIGEPHSGRYNWMGYGILLFLIFVFLPLTWLLRKEYWRGRKPQIAPKKNL